jgi:hypothetical protein
MSLWVIVALLGVGAVFCGFVMALLNKYKWQWQNTQLVFLALAAVLGLGAIGIACVATWRAFT